MMYKLCWLTEGKKKTKSFSSLEEIKLYLKCFVYNGEWIELNNKKINIDVSSMTAEQLTLI